MKFSYLSLSLVFSVFSVFPGNLAFSVTSIEEKVVQGLDTVLDDPALARVIYELKDSPQQREIKDLLIKNARSLAFSLNASNWQSQKVRLSSLLGLAHALYPEAKLDQLMINPGKNVPRPPEEALQKNPQLMEELYYSVGLTPEAIVRLSRLAHRYFQTDPTRQPALTFVAGAYLPQLIHSLFQNQMESSESYYLVQSPVSQHTSLLIIQRLQGVLRVGVLDSFGYDAEKERDVNAYLRLFSEIASIYRQKVTLYGFAAERQHDLVSCSQFVLRDYFAFKDMGFFHYVDTLLSRYPYSMGLSSSFQSELSSFFILPEHPAMLVLMQSRSVLEMLKPPHLQGYMVRDLPGFQSKISSQFWSNQQGRSVNAQAQVDLFHHVLFLLEDILR